MSIVYFHVGPHKTGTTMIQKFMLDNQAPLAVQGLVYPNRHLQIFGHHPFRERIVQRDLSDEDVGFLKKDGRNVLLSSEDFISLDVPDFEYLRQRLAGMTVKVVYSWRRASGKLYSIWQEVIKHGGTVDFFAYYHEHLARPAMSMMLSPDLKLAAFSRVFGKSNVIVLDYDHSARTGRLVEDFLQAVDITPDSSFVRSDDKAHVKNAAMQLADVETIRAMNFWFRHNKGIHGPSVRIAYLKHRDSLTPKLDDLQEIIRRYTIDLSLGGYFIDVRGEKIMTEKYADNMTNYQPATGAVSQQVPGSEWSLDVRAVNLVEQLCIEFTPLVEIEHGGR